MLKVRMASEDEGSSEQGGLEHSQRDLVEQWMGCGLWGEEM